MYTVFIRPPLEYAAVVWDGCSQSDVEKLEKVQLCVIFSYNNSFYYHSTVVSFRTNCSFCGEDLVSCQNLRKNHVFYIQ